MIRKTLSTFFKSEIAIGVSLMIATVVALLTANSEGAKIYHDFFNIHAPINLSFIGIPIYKNLTLLEWVNDALMAIFFLLVGMELKKEILIGELSTKQKFSLPAIAATGGILIPIAIFSFFNYGNPENMRGFAVAGATDIAFAYGMISLFGKTISNSLKIFLVALAVLDDLVAILIIAFFYSDNVDSGYLFYAVVTLLVLTAFNKMQVKSVKIYLILGAILWLMVLKSGIHATFAGVLLAMFIPMNIGKEPILSRFAHQITPMVNFLILPIFAFANAGISLDGFSLKSLLDPLVLGVAAGLFIGKQIGVMFFSFVAVKMRFSYLPRGTDWLEFYAAAIFTGIGFTMSLFIGSLAFLENYEALNLVKIGVLAGSLLSVLYGSFIIFLIKFNRR
jgi:NhaA family Na+:H+ antiporter